MDKMKRVFSLVLVLAMLVGSFSSFSTVAFAEEAKKEEVKVEEVKKEETKEEVKEEVKEETKEVKVDDTKVLSNVPKDVIGTEYEDAVTRLVAFGVIGGYPDGTYKPEEEINRAQFSKIMVMALGLNDAVPAAQNKATGFSDVQAGYWAAGYINVASGQGLLKGYPDGTFRPANKVSYAESLTMLVRALGYQDEFLPGNWPGNYVAKAAEAGITKDVKMPTDAKEGAKRGPVAQMVNNTFDAKIVKVDKYKPNTKEVEYYETNITLLKDKLEISKYENTRVVADKIVDDGLAKDELRVRFLESIDRYGKDSSYSYQRGEVVKRSYGAGEQDTLRFNEFVTPRTIIGEEVTTYVNDNDKVVYIERENDDKANFEYIEGLKDSKYLELVAFDKEYNFEEGRDSDSRRNDAATINIFDSKDNKYRTYDAKDLNKDQKQLNELVGRMGKVVVRNNKIVYAEIMESADAKEFMVAMKNDKGLIEGINDKTSNFKKDLRDDKDYDKVLVHDTKGNVMSVEDIKEGNVLYIDELKYDGDDVANVVVVKDNKTTGEMGKYKTDRITVADKEIKTVKYKKDTKDANETFATRYSVDELDEIKAWEKDSSWEDDMDDAYKKDVVVYKDAVGRIAFLTTASGNSGYKFGIVTRTYADGDRVRIYTTIDGKEGKDQIFKAEKDQDVEKPFVLAADGTEDKNPVRKTLKTGMAVKFRLNNDGEIAKERMFVMPESNLYAMDDDFGKDVIKARKATVGGALRDERKSFAVNSDSTVAIDAPRVSDTNFPSKDLDGAVMMKDEKGNDLKIDVDDFNVTTWKEMKEDKKDSEVRFYVFPKAKEAHEVDGLVFIGKNGANTGSDEIAIYVTNVWKGSDVEVEYAKYGESGTVKRDLESGSKLISNNDKYKAYVAKERTNGRLTLVNTSENSHNTKDFQVYKEVSIENVKGNYITLSNGEKLLTTNSTVYHEDKSKSASFLEAGMEVQVISDGVRARVIGVDELKGGTTKPEEGTKGKVTYINSSAMIIDGKTYEFNNSSILYRTSNLKVGVALGGTEIANLVKVNDEVSVTKLDGKVALELKEVKVAKLETQVKEAVKSTTKTNLDAVLGLSHKAEGDTTGTPYFDMYASDVQGENIKTFDDLQAAINAADAKVEKGSEEEAGIAVNNVIKTWSDANAITNKAAKDQRDAYEELTKAGKAKVTDLDKLEAVEAALTGSKAALNKEIESAEKVYVEESALLNSLTDLHKANITAENSGEPAAYTALVSALKVEINKAKAVKTDDDNTTAKMINDAIGTDSTLLKGALKNVNDNKADFHALVEKTK